MPKRAFIGMLTPSSNTALEPLCYAIVEQLKDVSIHFARFRVTEISLDDQGLHQFNLQPMLDAAHLLANARMDIIVWNGTSAGWLGFENDEKLCAAITKATGIPATTSVLALNELFVKHKIQRFGLVTPYTTDVQKKIIANYRQHGFECIAEHHLGIRDNFAFSQVDEDTLRTAVRQVAKAKPQAVATFCTNLHAAHLAASLERELNIPIFDTVSVTIWKSLIELGRDPSQIRGWGSLFSDDHFPQGIEGQ